MTQTQETQEPLAARPDEDVRTQVPAGRLERYFHLAERGSTVGREVRGGLTTFFAMAYIVLLNPIIIGSAADVTGAHLSVGELTTATAFAAAVTTLLMGFVGNAPLALAAGLGTSGVVVSQISPHMTWPQAMGLMVIEGVVIILLVVTGLRETIMNAIPLQLKHAISVGIGMFVALIGLVDSGVVTRQPDSANTTVPVQLGVGGHLQGWPAFVFCFGLLLMIALMARRIPGAILIGIVASTVLAVVIEKAAKVPDQSWGLVVPKEARTVFPKRSLSTEKMIQWLTNPDGRFGIDPAAARDALLLKSLTQSVSELERRLGPDRNRWRYGQESFKHVRLAHPLSAAVTAELRSRLDLGPLPRGGYGHTVNSTSNDDNQSAGASFRIIADTGDWERSVGTNTPGQSGDPASPHYRDHFEPWADGLYFPVYFARPKIETVTETKTTLVP